MYYFLLGIIIYAFLISMITQKYRLMSEISGILILTSLTFIIGLRYGVGIDYFSYELGFNTRYYMFLYEPIYSLLMYIIKIIFDKFHYLTFIMILITNIFIYLGLKKRKVAGIYIILAIFIYSSNTALIFMNAMRQGVAVAIFFYASNYIKEKKIKKYFILMLLGAGFHSSILLLLPMYFMKNIKLSRINYLLIAIASYVLVATRVAQTLLNFIAYRIPMYSKYYNHNYLFNKEVNLLAFGVLLNVIFAYSLLLTQSKEKQYKQETNYYLIGTLINILALSSFMFDRVGVYFFIFGIAAIPKIIENIKSRKLRIVMFSFAILIATSFFAKSLFINSEALMLEYKSIFSIQ